MNERYSLFREAVIDCFALSFRNGYTYYAISKLRKCGVYSIESIKAKSKETDSSTSGSSNKQKGQEKNLLPSTVKHY